MQERVSLARVWIFVQDEPSNQRQTEVNPAAESKVGHGRFTLKKILGQGGMGTVWLAQDNHLQESVALKFLPPQIRFDPAAISMLRKETSRSRKLSHPNIIRSHDFHQHEGEDPFIAMEYVEGHTLHALRFQQPREIFSWDKLTPWTRQLCDALDYAHSEKIIHRDLKPSNLMLDTGGRLKLADFGIATVISDSVTRLSGNIAGTPLYMSPQQMDGKAPQPTDDIYSLGATLYELLTGTPPFHTGQIVHQVLHNEPEPPSERLAEFKLHNEIPPDVEAMIMACLAKDAARRPQSARAVADWIGLQPPPHAKSLAATITPSDEELQAAAAAVTSRKRWRVLTMIFPILLLGAGGWFWATKLSPKKTQTAPAKVVSLPQTDAANGESIVFADDFENTEKLSPWDWGNRTGKSILAENGNHFFRIVSTNTHNNQSVEITFPIQPGLKNPVFMLRTRTSNLTIIRDYKYSGAKLQIYYLDDKKSKILVTSTHLMREDSDWVVVKKPYVFPTNTRFVRIAMMIDQGTGIADFDDIKVTVAEESGQAVEQIPVMSAVEAGFTNLFNGRDLSGWDGDPKFWSVKNGCIVGQTSQTNLLLYGKFLIWRGGIVENFELRFSVRLSGDRANSGFNYRCVSEPAFGMLGYQTEIASIRPGYLLELRRATSGRKLALPGQKVVAQLINGTNQSIVLGSIADRSQVESIFKTNDWNDYVIIAQGNHLIHKINGLPVIDAIDEHPDQRRSGILGLELNGLGNNVFSVEFKNLRLKRLAP